MSQTVPSQHPAVVLRSHYQHLRALLTIAIAVILGLTTAVVVLAINSNHVTRARPTTQSATYANSSAGTGSGPATQTTDRLANYPDAPPPPAGTPQPSISYYLDAPRP